MNENIRFLLIGFAIVLIALIVSTAGLLLFTGINPFERQDDRFFSWESSSTIDNKMKEIIKEKSEFQLKEIFDFEFDRAYVFKDSYLSGDAFVKIYDVDIDISNMFFMPDHDHFMPIVFVDKEGKLIFEYQASNGLFFPDKGMVIYPNTVIKAHIIPEDITERKILFDRLYKNDKASFEWYIGMEVNQPGKILLEFLNIQPEDYYKKRAGVNYN